MVLMQSDKLWADVNHSVECVQFMCVYESGGDKETDLSGGLCASACRRVCCTARHMPCVKWLRESLVTPL